ncbi:DUF4340 domain-containing protein [cf. Phormidesmis sp. LEGE 11477]|uniref:DUF4340 domain-containing protein n=1 Tax=cf. Phormidesmis sp. LEGE 11477 TaxID=1828680 RepID=UPI00187F8CF9|nr:DUF4340 domain-containing protein [cf. Phormidesmis sp. LEGE 11477]MBE9063826.1 DUF4340 domain-containing protein [cf. Phormidesmis sp. LEGE 11477]
MLNRGTLLLLVVAIALGGGVLLFENSDRTSRDPSTEAGAGEAQGKPLLPFEESAIAQFTLSRPDQSDLTFVKDESGVWQMSTPEEQVAEEGAIAFLLSQLTRSSNRVINVDSRSLVDFGLDNPTATITLESDVSEEKSTYQILVGDSDFGGDQRYIQVIDLNEEQINADGSEQETEIADSVETEESSDLEIHLVSGGIINAIERPTSEWLVAEEEATDEVTDSQQP